MFEFPVPPVDAWTLQHWLPESCLDDKLGEKSIYKMVNITIEFLCRWFSIANFQMLPTTQLCGGCTWISVFRSSAYQTTNPHTNNFTNQSVNQPTNQLQNQLINKISFLPSRQSVNQSIKTPSSQLHYQPTSPSIHRKINQSRKQTSHWIINQLTTHHINHPTNLPVNHTANVSQSHILCLLLFVLFIYIFYLSVTQKSNCARLCIV